MDLASGHLLALDALESPNHIAFSNLPDRAKYKAYNLGKGQGQSVFDIVRAMAKATGYDYKTEVVGRRWDHRLLYNSYFLILCLLNRLGDVPDLTADPSLAEKELGFHAAQSLETSCRDLWNWQSKNPEGYATPHPTPFLPSSANASDVPHAPLTVEDETTSPSVIVDTYEPGSSTSSDDEHIHAHSQSHRSGVSTPTAVESVDGESSPVEGSKIRDIRREDVFPGETILQDVANRTQL